MLGHPANRRKQIEAMERAGVDPKVGEWPGDPGYEGDGSVKHVLISETEIQRISRECIEATEASDQRGGVVFDVHAAIKALNVLLEQAARCGIYADIKVGNVNVTGATARGVGLTAVLRKIR